METIVHANPIASILIFVLVGILAKNFTDSARLPFSRTLRIFWKPRVRWRPCVRCVCRSAVAKDTRSMHSIDDCRQSECASKFERTMMGPSARAAWSGDDPDDCGPRPSGSNTPSDHRADPLASVLWGTVGLHATGTAATTAFVMFLSL